jgi:sarcosine oxidase
VVVLERSVPGAGQSAGVARGFRHLHATPEQIAAAVRARAGWDAWSERAGEPLVGEEGALRLGGDVEGDAARLRAAGVEAAVVERAGSRHRALAPDAGPLLWDPRGGAIRAQRTIEWLCAELGDRVDRVAVQGVDPTGRGHVHLSVGGGRSVRARRVVLAAGAGLVPLLDGSSPFRRVIHLRITFAMPGSDGWAGATWADRSGRYGALAYGVADGPGRFALGLAELDAQPPFDDPYSDAIPPDTDLSVVRERLLAYAAAAFPGLGEPVDEVVRLLTVLPGEDEDRYHVSRDGKVVFALGHNLFKLAPILGEEIADASV